MLIDLYDAHQDGGLAPRSVYQIHACLSSMSTQGCQWGWRDTNPAHWADPPAIPNTTPVVPDPEQVQRLMEAAKRSRRPEYARAGPRRIVDERDGVRAVPLVLTFATGSCPDPERP